MKQRILVSQRFAKKKNSDTIYSNSGFFSTKQKSTIKKFKAIDSQMEKWNLEYVSDVY